MQSNPTPSALAIRRATRVRELNKMRADQLRPLFHQRLAEQGARSLMGGPATKETLINEILHIEGLDMAVLQ